MNAGMLFNRLRGLFRAPSKKDGECVICMAGHPDLKRLAQIIGKLPVGEQVQLPKLRDGLDCNFKTLISDLEYLIFELGLPIRFSTRRVALLKAPVSLCPIHARIAGREAKRPGNASLRTLEGTPLVNGGRTGFCDPVSPPL